MKKSNLVDWLQYDNTIFLIIWQWLTFRPPWIVMPDARSVLLFRYTVTLWFSGSPRTMIPHEFISARIKKRLVKQFTKRARLCTPKSYRPVELEARNVSKSI